MPRLLFAAALLLTLAPARTNAAELLPPKDLGGRWYMLARYPEKFQTDCYGTQARVTLRDDGDVQIESVCKKGGFDGRESKVSLKVGFPSAERLLVRIWFLRKELKVFDFDPSASLVTVGTPDKRHLFVVARKPTLAEKELARLKDRLAQLGFDLKRLEMIPQR